MFENDTENSTIILFPDFVKIKEEVEKLRIEVSMLLSERDELRFVECKNIEAAYMLLLGSLEYKAYEWECKILRIRRKIELVQAKKNRREKIILTDIEGTLDEEFEEYQKRLNEQIDKMNQAINRSKGDFLTAEEVKEIKSLYRSVVKSLHPDLNPDIGEAELQMFDNAVQAYESGDIYSLRIIADMFSEKKYPDKTENAMSELLKEKERLTRTLEKIKAQIDRIKSEFPYTEKEFIKDDKKIEERKAELKQLISDMKDIYEIYAERLEEMLR